MRPNDFNLQYVIGLVLIVGATSIVINAVKMGSDIRGWVGVYMAFIAGGLLASAVRKPKR